MRPMIEPRATCRAAEVRTRLKDLLDPKPRLTTEFRKGNRQCLGTSTPAGFDAFMALPYRLASSTIQSASNG